MKRSWNPVTSRLKVWQLDFAGLTLCAALAAGAYFGLVSPASARRSTAEVELRHVEQLGRETTLLRNELRRVTNGLEEAESELANHPLRLDAASRVNARLAELTEAAGARGLMVVDTRPEKLLTSPRHAVVPIELAGSGRFRDCVQFMHDLRQTFPDSGVAAFELSSNPADSSAQVSFHFRIHWFVDPTGREPGR